MQSIQEKVIVDLILQHHRNIHLLEGLGGFETEKDFSLIANAKESPLIWLQSRSFPDLAFVTVDPFLVYPDYLPDFEEEDLQALEIENEGDTLVLCIAHVKGDMTINLVAPLLINLQNDKGKQVILKNNTDYSLNHPIFR